MDQLEEGGEERVSPLSTKYEEEGNQEKIDDNVEKGIIDTIKKTAIEANMTRNSDDRTHEEASNETDSTDNGKTWELI